MLEKKLQQEVIQKCELAQSKFDCKMVKLIDTINRFGIVRTMQEIIRKGRTSDCFNKLADKNRIDLTVEATIVKKEYAELFSDEEVNYCYDLLCEKGYYNF